MIKISCHPLQKGLNKLVGGIVNAPNTIHCDSEGSLLITWLDGSVSSESFYDDEDRDVKNRILSSEIESGVFSFSSSIYYPFQDMDGIIFFTDDEGNMIVDNNTGLQIIL